MSAQTEAELVRLVQDHAVQLVAKAGDQMIENLRRPRNGAVPYDSGRLAKGLRRGQVRRAGASIEVDIESFATSDEGFDYPAFIDKVARVVPTRRRYLRWYAGGRPVFSKGFDNRWKGWWKDSITAQAWREAVEEVSG